MYKTINTHQWLFVNRLEKCSGACGRITTNVSNIVEEMLREIALTSGTANMLREKTPTSDSELQMLSFTYNCHGSMSI